MVLCFTDTQGKSLFHWGMDRQTHSFKQKLRTWWAGWGLGAGKVVMTLGGGYVHCDMSKSLSGPQRRQWLGPAKKSWGRLRLGGEHLQGGAQVKNRRSGNSDSQAYIMDRVTSGRPNHTPEKTSERMCAKKLRSARCCARLPPFSIYISEQPYEITVSKLSFLIRTLKFIVQVVLLQVKGLNINLYL